METMLIQLANQRAARLLHALEDPHLIKVLQTNATIAKAKLSGKYKGTISKEKGQNLNEHIKQMRNEWNSI